MGFTTCDLLPVITFYTVSRLLLYLIQALAWLEVGAQDEFHILDINDREMSPRAALQSLQFKPE
jgi:hypothetical protein